VDTLPISTTTTSACAPRVSAHARASNAPRVTVAFRRKSTSRRNINLSGVRPMTGLNRSSKTSSVRLYSRGGRKSWTNAQCSSLRQHHLRSRRAAALKIVHDTSTKSVSLLWPLWRLGIPVDDESSRAASRPRNGRCRAIASICVVWACRHTKHSENPSVRVQYEMSKKHGRWNRHQRIGL